MCCRMRGEGETRREALLRELHDLEAKLNPMRCGPDRVACNTGCGASFQCHR